MPGLEKIESCSFTCSCVRSSAKFVDKTGHAQRGSSPKQILPTLMLNQREAAEAAPV